MTEQDDHHHPFSCNKLNEKTLDSKESQDTNKAKTSRVLEKINDTLSNHDNGMDQLSRQLSTISLQPSSSKSLKYNYNRPETWVECYGIPVTFKAKNLIEILRESDVDSDMFRIQWKSHSHAIIKFYSEFNVDEFLKKFKNPLIQVKKYSNNASSLHLTKKDSSEEIKSKAQSLSRTHHHHVSVSPSVVGATTERPKTSPIVAARLITRSLGLKCPSHLKDPAISEAQEKKKAEKAKTSTKQAEIQAIFDADT